MDENALTRALRGYVISHLGTKDVVLVVDETGDIKQGARTVGVARQYTGTTAQVENCRVAVYLAYTTPKAHALIDHRLYLPASWTGDEVYGRNSGLRAYLEQQRVGYVMEMAATDRLNTPRGPLAVKGPAVLVPAQGWQKRSAGAGFKDERFYDWALIDDEADAAGVRWVLIRRNRSAGELAFFRCYAPTPVPLSRLVAVAGRRWRVEESFQQGKNLTGLDERQVRMWTSWHRWSLLAMVAYAFLALCRLRELALHRADSGLVALSCNEIARLFHALFSAAHGLEHALGWSVFRRAHQGRAQRCHYRRRAVLES